MLQKIISVKNKKLYEGTLTSDDINKDEGFKLSKNGIKTDTPNGSKFVATDLVQVVAEDAFLKFVGSVAVPIQLIVILFYFFKLHVGSNVLSP